MGTCLDWHSSIVPIFPHQIPESIRSALAIEWRHDYFDYNAALLAAGKSPEDIDITLLKTLTTLLAKPQHTVHAPLFTEDVKTRCIGAWHSMTAWPDVAPALDALKAAGHEIFVFANGTTRLQLDLCRSSGLSFNMLFSSQLLGVYEPAPESYRRTLELVGVQPSDAVMIAAHAYDTRGAKEVGMKTIYVRRWTDDVNEDMDVVRGENDVFLDDGMAKLAEAVGRL